MRGMRGTIKAGAGGRARKGLMKKEIEELLKEVERDEYAQYSTEWQGRAVAVLNEYNIDRDYYDDEIFDLNSDEWDEVVRQQLDSRGALGLLFFLGKIEPCDEWGQLDGYGNAVAVSGGDFVGMLKDARDEVED